ncbi:hypothetical protein D930_00881, partial [Enterococcus faecalis KI-6-1-110608-1]
FDNESAAAKSKQLELIHRVVEADGNLDSGKGATTENALLVSAPPLSIKKNRNRYQSKRDSRKT